MYVLNLLYLERGMVPKQYIAKKNCTSKLLSLNPNSQREFHDNIYYIVI